MKGLGRHVFYDWINDSMEKTLDASERALMFRSLFAIAKRLLDSKLDDARLARISSIISNLRSLHENKMLFSSRNT